MVKGRTPIPATTVRHSNKYRENVLFFSWRNVVRQLGRIGLQIDYLQIDHLLLL